MPFHLFWWPHWLCKLRCRPFRHWELVNTNRGLISAFQLSRILTLFFSPWHTNHKQTNLACFQILDKNYALLMFWSTFQISTVPSRDLSILFVIVQICGFVICKSTRLCKDIFVIILLKNFLFTSRFCAFPQIFALVPYPTRPLMNTFISWLTLPPL